MSCPMITILGPTACGKTAVATLLAARLGDAEIISADSRQVFRGMDIGTGKDLSDYTVHEPLTARPALGSAACIVQEPIHIPYHLIDIADAGTKYSVFEFQRDFLRAYNNICSRARKTILCGGTGLYIESVLRAYKLVEVPVNAALRERLEGKSLEELTALLATYKRLHNTTDVDTARRAIRAIEIEEYYREHHIDETQPFPDISSQTFGLDIPRELRRKRITARLHKRLAEGMLEEVQRLLDSGIPAEALISYGLEYRYLTLYLTGELTYDEMVRQLEIAIHQFAKRQMTYFRGMERRGVEIHWIDATRPKDLIVQEIIQTLPPTPPCEGGE
ncbi:MAG: tRNA (adenosine(37)-N6)-dimethylallyltransferase MiaA [Bacteroidaceae bacterium]|nr:tRNA (adenosine(37)-N6)-dimethylallyltransferase MiaA [Bacteroidaceae bacterium]